MSTIQAFHTILAAVQAPILYINAHGIIEYANPSAMQLLATADQDLQGSSVHSRLQQDPPLPVMLTFTAPSAVELPWEFTLIWTGADTAPLRLNTICHAYGDGFVWTLKAASEDAEMYRQMFENNRSVKLLIDPETALILDANPAASAYYGYSRDDLQTMSVSELNPRPLAEIKAALREAAQGDRFTFQWQHRLASGELRDVQVSTAPLYLGGRTLIYSIITDVTEAVRVQTHLRESEMRYRLMAETMEQGVIVVDTDLRLIFVNDVFSHGLGYGRRELIGQSITDLLSDESKSIIRQQLQRRYKGESSRYELELLHRQGSRRYCIVAATPIQSPEGDYRGSFAIVTDITERRQTEEALLKSNAELDAFSHTVAHDLKNPLSVLLSFAHLLESEFGTLHEDQVHEALQMVGDTSAKMLKIVDDLLLLAQMRHQEVTSLPLDMPRIIDDALQRVSYTVSKYKATVIVPEKLPVALGYAPWIEAVWANYITNAIKYGGTPPRVELSARLLPNKQVMFCVTDNGKGIPPDKINKLFVPFERLEEARAKGYGIGLSIIQRIMEKLGGEVRVESTVGKGSTFCFILPTV